jgi:hypothetical protein
VNRFNLSFKGEILPGRKVEQVKQRFGKMFAIEDPVRVDSFFSGQTIILRRNLDRKTAAEYFQKLRKLGVEVELVKVTAQDRAATITKAPPPPTDTEEAARREEAEHKAAEEAERQQAEEAAREKVLREEAERKAAEEAERRQAELAEKKRIEEEEAAQQRELREEEERKAAEEAEHKTAEEAARLKAEEAEKKRKSAEEAARLKAEEQRKKAEESARLKARRAEEATRKKALKEEARRKAAAEAARRKAEQQRKKRLEEEARHKAELEKKKRMAAEKAARLKAELAEEKRKAAEEVAREQAILKEAKRKAAEEAAREQAILDEAKRKAAAEVARLQAEQEKVAREAAERVARLRAEQEEVARKAAAEVARIQAEQQREKEIEQHRIAAEKAAEEAAARQAAQEEAKRKAAAQAASKKAAKARQKRQQAEKAARSKAEEQRKREQHQAQLRAVQEEQTAHRVAMEEQAAQRAAVELAQQPALKPARARVKSNLELPQRSGNRGIKASTTTSSRRQAGEPNLYSLRPFRNTPEVRVRAEQSQARMRVGFIAAALALAGLLLLGGRFLSLPTVPAITGAGAIAMDAQGGPALLAGDSILLHDRSGVGTGTLPWESLGLAALQAPMAFDTAGELLALGRLKNTGAEAVEVESLQLLRCNLTESLCRPFSAELANSSIAGFAIHSLDGTVLLADAVNDRLLKTSADGTVLARAEAPIPDNPVLRLESGLLFMNSALGPAVSVFRYDDSAFGQQLDEILLLPPAAIEAEQSRVGDFVLSTDNWWASMYNPQTNSAGLYRFDAQWNFIEQAELPAHTWPQQLATWGDKTLVRDAHRIPIQRFNASGAPEAPLVSDLLESLVARQQRNTNLKGVAWQISLILCALMAITGLCLGSLQRLRALVYKPHRERGADPVDEYVDAIHWIDPVTDRRAQLRRTTISYAVIALALLLLAITRHVAPIQLAAALIALSGPAIALLLLGRSSVGHIGILQEQLLLVDHTGMYHLGGGPRVQYRGPFLLLDDVVVFAGTRLLPAFSSKQVEGRVTPLAEAGIKVDRKTAIVKLLQCRHPLAQGAVAVLVAFTAAAVLLCLQGIF